MTTTADLDVTPTTDHREPGDSEKFSHYVDKDKGTEAYLTGSAVVALCGKVWVPTRDPKKFPVCPECQRLYDLGPEGRMREARAREEGT